MDGAESAESVQKRVVCAFEEMVKNHPNQNVAVISHGVAIKTALAWYLACDITKLHEVQLPENGSVTKLSFSLDGCTVERG